jgi:hypothetical protein
MPKYFIGATVTKYYSAEIEADNEVEANHMFWRLDYDPDRGVIEHDDEIEEEIHTNFEVKEDG